MTGTAAPAAVLTDAVTPCAEELDAKGWDETIGVDLGGFGVGIRVATPELGATVRALLGDLVDDGLDVQPNWSLRLGRSGAVGTSLHLLYRAWTPVVRARSRRRVVDALLGHLTDYRDAPAIDLVPVQAALLVRDGRATVVPADLFTVLGEVQRRIEAAGWRIADRPRVLLDPATGEAVVRRSDIPVDADAYAALVGDDDAPTGAVEPGSYPIERWVVHAGAALSRGGVVAAAARLVDRGRWSRPGDAVLGAIVASVRAAVAVPDPLDRSAWFQLFTPPEVHP